MMGRVYSNTVSELDHIRVTIEGINSHAQAMLYKMEQVRMSFSELASMTNAINGVRDQTQWFSDAVMKISSDMRASRANVEEHMKHLQSMITKLSDVADDPWVNRTIDDLKIAASQFESLFGREDDPV